MFIKRKPTKRIKVGNTFIGGNEPIRVQGMCTTHTSDIKATINQIHELESIGCELVRVNVMDEKSAEALSFIKKEIQIPLIADVLFDDSLIVKAIRRGADKVRINPGKLDKKNLERIIFEAQSFQIPIRVSINSGSLPSEILNLYGQTTQGLVEAALKGVGELEAHNFENIIVSIKSADVIQTLEANLAFASNV